MIGENVEVKVLSGNGNQVRLGISAPREIDVVRKEVFEANPRSESESQAKT